MLKQAFVEELGFAAPQIYRRQVAELARLYREGKIEALNTHHRKSKSSDRQRSTTFSKILMASNFSFMKAGAEELEKIRTIFAV